MSNHAQKIIDVLNEMFPDAKAELDFTNNFELLIAVVLSAQTTDVGVNKVTPVLFQKYSTPEKMMHAPIEDLENILKSIGLYKNKAKNIKALSKILYEQHDSKVPSDRQALEALPGVGRKTTNVVISNAFNIPAFAVDTHVERVSKRLGIANNNDNVITVEKKLMEYFDKKHWLKLHHQMIFFGRYHCKAQKPNCAACPLFDICTYDKK